MIRLHSAFWTLGTAFVVASCSGNDANLGSGQDGTMGGARERAKDGSAGQWRHGQWRCGR